MSLWWRGSLLATALLSSPVRSAPPDVTAGGIAPRTAPLSGEVGGSDTRASTPSEAVTVTVTVVLARAGSGNTEVAPELAALGPTLTRAFPDHRRFSRVGRHALAVTATGASPVTLPNGSTLTLRHGGLRDGRHALQVEVGGLRTTVQATPGSTFFQAGRAHEGGILVLAFEVAR